MYTRMIHPDELSPAELDAFLAQGWFRMRQAMFTCRFVMSDGRLRTAVWLRFDLSTFRFRKSLRRYLRRADAELDLTVGPADVTDEHEELYARYREDFKGDLAPDLRSVLYDDGSTDIYPTSCFELRRDGRLVACSFFDVGVDSMASIIGIYDPDLHRYGLGFTTMLLEVRYGIENGLRWFYPGYIAPGCEAFDYKLRLGDPEYYAPLLARWMPYADLDLDELPAIRITTALDAFETAARDGGHATERWLYPPYAVVGMDPRGDGYLAEPAFVQLPDVTTGAGRLIVTHDANHDRYTVELFARVRDLRKHFGGIEHPRGGPRQCHDLLRRVRRVGMSATAEGALALALGPGAPRAGLSRRRG